MTEKLTKGARVRVIGNSNRAGQEGVVESVGGKDKNGLALYAFVRFGLLVWRVDAVDLELLPPVPGGEQ